MNWWPGNAQRERTTFGSLSRGELMSRVHSTGNQTTEKRLVFLLRKVGLTGWRRHQQLTGCPDFVWPEMKVAVLVDGCFWHGHNCGKNVTPKTNVQACLVDENHFIRGMFFGGFRKCLYPVQKFDSNAERRFAVILEHDDTVLKWVKPARGAFKISYRHDETYEPDFVVETTTTKYLCEPKRADQMNQEDVQAKANAAATWCRHATGHEAAHEGKPWSYLLIPDNAIQESKTLQGLAGAFSFVA